MWRWWHSPAAGGGQSLPLKLHFYYTTLVDSLLELPPYKQHAEALAASPGAQRKIAAFLLRQALPDIAAAMEAGAQQAGGSTAEAGSTSASTSTSTSTSLLHTVLDRVSASVRTRQLMPAVAHLSRQPGGDCVPLAARIIMALPTRQHSDAAPGSLGRLHANAALLLGSLCWLLFPENWNWPEPAGGGQARAASGGGASIVAGSSDPLVAAAHCGSEQQRLAAWEVVRLVPHMAHVLRQLAADSGGCSQECLGFVCQGYGLAVHLLHYEFGSMHSTAELEAWTAAAHEGLRLLPLLADLDARWRPLGLGEAQANAAAALSGELITSMWQYGAQFRPLTMLTRWELVRQQQRLRPWCGSCGSCTALAAAWCTTWLAAAGWPAPTWMPGGGVSCSKAWTCSVWRLAHSQTTQPTGLAGACTTRSPWQQSARCCAALVQWPAPVLQLYVQLKDMPVALASSAWLLQPGLAAGAAGCPLGGCAGGRGCSGSMGAAARHPS